MLRTLTAALVVAAGFGLFAATDTPEIRYSSASNSGACLARQIINLPADVKVVVLGSSRIREAVSSDQMSELLGNGESGSVYNLARPGLSTPRSFFLLRDIYAAGIRPKAVVLEVALDAIRGVDMFDDDNRDTWDWVIDTAYVASYSDIVNLPIEASEAGYVGQYALISRGILKKLEHGIARFASGTVEDMTLPEGQHPLSRCTIEKRENPSEKALRKKARKLAKHKNQVEEAFGLDPDVVDDSFELQSGSYTRVELSYLEQIRRLTEKYGSILIVVRPHRYAWPPYSSRVSEQILEIVPEARIPPSETVRATNAGFFDPSHMGKSGREIYTAWLTLEIKKLLAEQ